MASVLVSTVLMSAAPASARLRSNEEPIPNPDLETSCGLDILLILDESRSVSNAGAVDDVRTAFKAFTDALKNTSSSMAVAEFATQARLPAIGPFAPGDYITITDSTKAALDQYVDTEYDPDDLDRNEYYTNWEDALRMGIPNHAPRPDPVVPHLTVLITDGDPNRVIRSWVSDDDYANKVPLGLNQISSTNENTAADHAVGNANNLKTQGSHILAIAVGSGLDGNAALNRLIKVSGPDVYDGGGGAEFDISTDDIYREEDFSKLEDALRDAAFQLCAPSITIEKLVDETPDPDSAEDALPGIGWEIEGEATVVGGYDWVLPDDTAPEGPVIDLTDGAGFSTFQWNTNGPVDSEFTATETIQPGYSNDPDLTSCTFRTPDASDQPLDPDFVGDGTFTVTIPTDAIVTCEIVNIADPDPGISLQKYTNGRDADTATGPDIPKGDPVNWAYLVENTGNTTLTDVTVTDVEVQPSSAAGPNVTCPEDTLAPGASMTCSATGESGLRADGSTEFVTQYQNEAEVTAEDSYGTPVSDNDPSHYFSSQAGISLQKSTNGIDADLPPGPLVAPGSTVTWTYEIINTGTNSLAGIQLFDDQIAPGPMPDVISLAGTVCVWPGTERELLSGESAICTATGTAIDTGQYVNDAEVRAVSSSGIVVDDDPSHYYSVTTGIDIEKSTNGEDADTPTGPVVEAGSGVSWTYVVTNTGNFPLLTWTVTDSDPKVKVSCPRVPLFPGIPITCTAKGVALTGQYSNIGTVSANDPLGGEAIVDSDPSHYLGSNPDVTIEKSTNGFDADIPPGPFVPVGGNVDWTYVVENEGNVTLVEVAIYDSIEGEVADPATAGDPGTCGWPGTPYELAPGATVTCTLPTATAIAGSYENLATVTARDSFSDVGDTDPSHYFGVEGALAIEKLTDGVDADFAPGPFIPEGEPVLWEYIVFNNGNTLVGNVEVVDDVEGVASCPQTFLASGASMTCTLDGTATRGQYANEATVTGLDPTNTLLEDTDPSHYFGYLSAIDVEKATNGEDADAPTGPIVPEGSTVTWTYTVTNPGDTSLRHVDVVDDQGVVPVFVGGDTDADDELDPGEVWTYEATGAAVAGQYANVATVTAFDDLEDEVTDEDPSHYFGLASGIDIEKSTNGEDADDPTGPQISVGAAVTWTYFVTNTGDAPISDIVVTDDQGVVPIYVSGDANTDDLLDVDETWIYEASEFASTGQYQNTGMAEGTDSFGAPVADADPSHYFGFEASISIEKTPDITVVNLGDPHTFTIEVTNTGDSVLTDVVVDDPVTPSCDRALGTLDPGEVVIYTCDVASVTEAITNVAFVTGIAPDGTDRTDQDDAWVGPFGVGGTGTIGDTVWADDNANGVQDSGEQGIAGATVTVTYLPPAGTAASIAAAGEVSQTYTTDTNGLYLAVGLIAGTYRVEVDANAVDGELTTPGTYTIPLAAGQEYLDADFGFDDALPATGADSGRILWLALVLLLTGGVLVVSTRRVVIRHRR